MGIRGLFVGINQYTTQPLKGCVNDATAIREWIKTRSGTDEAELRLLTDAQGTRQAIIDGLTWLAQPLNDGKPELRVFHFAGHGIQQPDTDGDEPDGSDECLVPVDYQTAGVLSDDELRKLYDGFGNSQILLLMDCCHSGTISKDIGAINIDDLRERFIPPSARDLSAIAAAKASYRHNEVQKIADVLNVVRNREMNQEQLFNIAEMVLNSVQKQGFGNPASHDNVVLISACKPEQTAADANFGGTYHGALTYFLLDALNKNASISYEALTETLRRAMMDNKFRQVPQLECHQSQMGRAFLS